MVSHICLLVELGPICNSMAASICLKSCEDHGLLKSYNGGLWKNIYRYGPNKFLVSLSRFRSYRPLNLSGVIKWNMLNFMSLVYKRELV